jgi:hypothetical protein
MLITHVAMQGRCCLVKLGFVIAGVFERNTWRLHHDGEHWPCSHLLCVGLSALLHTLQGQCLCGMVVKG